MAGHLGNHRKALAILGASDPSIPSISRDPPTGSLSPHSIAPWAMNSPPLTGNTTSSQQSDEQDFGSTYRLGENMDRDFERDTRRPSIASIVTMSSTGSRSSAGGRYHKKLQGFFGDEYERFDSSRQGSDASLNNVPGVPPKDGTKQRDRSNSYNTISHTERAASPSRPQTPQPSSEVTPWLFQNLNVSCSPDRVSDILRR